MSYDEEESSGSDFDADFAEDMRELRRACTVSGVDDFPNSYTADGGCDASDESDDEDIELLRSIQQRFSVPPGDIGIEDQTISMKPLNTILPSCLSDDNDDYGDDFETLHAIQRRFSHYNDGMNNFTESSLQRLEQVGSTNNIDLGKESSPNFFVKSNNNGQGFPDCVDGRATDQNSDIPNISPEKIDANVTEQHEPGSELVPVSDGGFPRSAQAFVEAIKKNRSCQKLIRNKLIELEARMEETRKLRERVKILKDFQMACRKRTSRALSQKKDARIQLISIPKQRANASKAKDKNTHAIYQGPAENPQVSHFREAMSRYPFSLTREPWSKEENEKLLKGIKQQFQKMLMQNLFSEVDADSCHLDNMIAKIRDHEITPQEIRSFLPKVNWEQLASMYLTSRSGPECESRWRNCEDPLINRQPWSISEDKKLLQIIQKRGLSSWIEIAKELETDRTPFQCLSRFQRSLNASIIKNEWTPQEDEELRKAVAEYGDTNWQIVASTLEGRTGTQCSNRWKKSLNPLRERVGKWDPDEDKRLKIAVRLFEAKNWNKIAKFVPGRTQVQCRERWVNCLDPSLNMNEWTEEEDLKLKAAIEEHGYCWSRIAACIPPRTDSQCRRRWKVLLPHEVPMLQVARQMKRSAFISNFVDREAERPDLDVKDLFIPRALTESDVKANEDHTKSINKKQRNACKMRSRRARKVARTDKVTDLTDEADVAECGGYADITANGEGPTTFDGNNKSDVKKKSTGKVKERNVCKMRSRRDRKVTHTEKVTKLTDEDDVAECYGHADITTSGEGPATFDGNNNSDIKKKSTGKLKGKDRYSFKVRSRRARQVTHTEKVMRLIDEDDVEDNDGHADVIGVLDQNNCEGSRTIEAETCEIKKKVTGKRKHKQRTDGAVHTEKELRLTDEDDPGDNGGGPTAWPTKACEEETDRILKKLKMANESSSSITYDPTLFITRASTHDANMNVKPLKVYSRRPKGSHNKKGGGCVQELQDEETLDNFLRKLKKRRLT